jgi:signal transduction histidine kinase
VAHELRNPLGSIALMGELLQRKVHGLQSRERHPELEGAHDLATRIRAEVARLEETVAAFLEFARTPELAAAAVDLAALVDELGAVLDPRPVLLGAAPLAKADPKAVKVVAGNLLANAAHAAGPQGRVEARFGEEPGQVVLQVWDSGAPVPEAQRERLFTPFFTTRPKGLGLGLATSASLAQAMGGSLSCDRDGKTFVLRLPVWPAS